MIHQRQQQEEQFRASDPDLIAESSLSTETQQPEEAEIEIATMNPHSEIPSDESYAFVPLNIKKNAHKPSKGTRSIMNNISLQDLQKMTDLFYEKAFRDRTLDKFIRSHHDPHGARFAKWIHQKLSGSTVWDEDRAERRRNNEVVHDRTSAHVAAWNSPKRKASDSGRRFKLEDCRVWMRIHFWALRESGLMEASPAFVDYYVRLIGHFVRVYESTAPMFARDSFRWSASPENIRRYLRDNRQMKDVLGLDFNAALSQLPSFESNDVEWPYNTKPTTTATIW